MCLLYNPNQILDRHIPLLYLYLLIQIFCFCFAPGGEIFPVSRRAADEDAEDVDFASRRVQVRFNRAFCYFMLNLISTSLTLTLSADLANPRSVLKFFQKLETFVRFLGLFLGRVRDMVAR